MAPTPGSRIAESEAELAEGRRSPERVDEPQTSSDVAERLSFASPVGATLVAVYAWYATAALFGPFSPVADDVGMLVLSATLVLALSVVHEVGHVLAGLLVGLDFRSLTVGPLVLLRMEHGYRVRPNGRWQRFAGCVERDFSNGWPDRLRLTVSAVGGPMANCLFAVALFATSERGGLAEDFALWSLLFGVINLVPLHINGQTSDGGLVWRMWIGARGRGRGAGGSRQSE